MALFVSRAISGNVMIVLILLVAKDFSKNNCFGLDSFNKIGHNTNFNEKYEIRKGSQNKKKRESMAFDHTLLTTP